ncbi:hypothetical protein BV133_3465 [Blastochloris viridis]|uniref:Uncharacterized protein n=1 Tax=Blastochloris viridis TaxID=1079 RepID=A0A182D6T9_BLAVI|nr:hypothetical protein BV133_3465 [Blastochloris viridis]
MRRAEYETGVMAKLSTAFFTSFASERALWLVNVPARSGLAADPFLADNAR